MSYYGDFYRGDPGFLSSIGGIFKRVVAPAALAVVPGGGFVSKAIGAAGGLLRRGRAVGGGLAKVVAKHPVLSGAAAAGAGGAALAELGRAPSARLAAGAMPGSGGMMRGGGGRRRRMNPYNPRALRRAVRRAHAFTRMAKRILRFTSPRPPKGRAVLRYKRRPRAPRV